MTIDLQSKSRNNINVFFEEIAASLPLVFDRDTATRSLGGILGKKTLANADAAGNGPSAKMKIGKKVLYEKVAFMEWLRTKIS